MDTATATAFDFVAFFWLMMIASAVAMVGRYVRVPYALALVMVGLLIGPAHLLPQVHLEPHILFTVFLPPLLFESALNMRVELLRRNWQPIAVLALAGTLLSTAVVGGLSAWLLGLPLLTGLLFGAIISPTDPVSVIALLKELNVSKRLATAMEAESLFNDGIAVVLFGLLLEAGGGGSITLVDGIERFLTVVAGGALLGGGIGALASRVTREFDDHLLEIMLTTVVAFGAFLGAESLGVSGVIAVVVAGLVMGSYGMETGMSPTTRLAVTSFWEYAAFAVNSVVFLLVGLEVTFVGLSRAFPMLFVAVAVVLGGRLLSVYGLSPLVKALGGTMPAAWRHVFFWGALRGALPMALVLGLGKSFPYREQLVMLTFGVVLFSLLVQGLSMRRLLRALGLSQAPSPVVEHGRLTSQILAARAALESLEDLRRRRVVSPATYDGLVESYRARLQELEARVEAMHLSDAELRAAQENEARRIALLAEKSALREAERTGLLDEEQLRELVADIDRRLESLLRPADERGGGGPPW
ncbi:MAG: Na+/H+ antiporter [Syntrophomonadaceae bacterium]|nr:Na+/H+ antiporter [Syntrophomonadaceae bacterium]